MTTMDDASADAGWAELIEKMVSEGASAAEIHAELNRRFGDAMNLAGVRAAIEDAEATPKPALDGEGRPLDRAEFLCRLGSTWYGLPQWFEWPAKDVAPPRKRGRPPRDQPPEFDIHSNPYVLAISRRDRLYHRWVRLPSQSRDRRIQAVHDEILKILAGLLHRRSLRSVRAYALAVEQAMISGNGKTLRGPQASYSTIERTVTAALKGLAKNCPDHLPALTELLRKNRRKG